MQTDYQAAIEEFREASADVRRAFGAVAEARERQIIANSQHAAASNALVEAQARLERADAALMQAREAQSSPQPSARVTQADIDAIEPERPIITAADVADAAQMGVA